jgi:hypothetical protein
MCACVLRACVLRACAGARAFLCKCASRVYLASVDLPFAETVSRTRPSLVACSHIQIKALWLVRVLHTRARARSSTPNTHARTHTQTDTHTCRHTCAHTPHPQLYAYIHTYIRWCMHTYMRAVHKSIHTCTSVPFVCCCLSMPWTFESSSAALDAAPASLSLSPLCLSLSL